MEALMFDIRTKKGKLAYQRDLVRNMIVMERINFKEIRSVLGRVYLDAARLLELGILDLNFLIDGHVERFKSIFVNHYKRVNIYASNKVFNYFNDKEKAETVPFIKTIKDEFWASILIWMQLEATRKVTKVNETTKKLIRNILDRGITSGKSYKEIAKDLRVIKDITNPSRAMTIARTETHTALVHGLDEALKTTEIEMRREWSTVLDERTRGMNVKDSFNHIIADGEEVGQEEPFIRTGESLMYPGDPAGSAGNIINCRCVILYNTVKEAFKSNFYKRRVLQWS